MIRPSPSFKKCWKCGRMFWCHPKSDALTGLEFVCPSCKGEKGGKINTILKILQPKRKT